MERWKIPPELLVYHPGWFEDTIPTQPRSESPSFASTPICTHRRRYALEHLYPLVSPGGFVLVDDFNLDGCRKALLEYVTPAPTLLSNTEQMKNILITFAGRAYDPRVARTVQDAPGFGAEEVLVYDDRFIIENVDAHGRSFRSVNTWLWETKRKFGFGWCSWKPYVIMHALSRCNNGDVVFYVDADCVPIADLTPVFNQARNLGIVLFDAQGWTNERVVRRDCFIAMGQDEPRYHQGKHACGRFSAFCKGDYLSQQLLMEWLTYSVNPLCQQWGDYQSQYGKDLADFTKNLSHPDGGEHRTEQAVLSLLAAKYDIQLHREACQFGWPIDREYCAAHNIVADLYPQLFHQEYCQGDRTDLSGSRFRNVSIVGGMA